MFWAAVLVLARATENTQLLELHKLESGSPVLEDPDLNICTCVWLSVCLPVRVSGCLSVCLSRDHAHHVTLF
jgi:hypothetical protein